MLIAALGKRKPVTQASRFILEKSYIYLGTAVTDRTHCIAWNSNKQRLVCDEHCSCPALHWKTIDGLRRPFVNEHKCIGCGICENACSIQSIAATKVFSFGDKRNLSFDTQKAFGEQDGTQSESACHYNQSRV